MTDDWCIANNEELHVYYGLYSEMTIRERKKIGNTPKPFSTKLTQK